MYVRRKKSSPLINEEVPYLEDNMSVVWMILSIGLYIVGTIALKVLDVSIAVYIPFTFFVLQVILTIVAYIKASPILKDVYKI